jgi:hypothetical protein
MLKGVVDNMTKISYQAQVNCKKLDSFFAVPEVEVKKEGN